LANFLNAVRNKDKAMIICDPGAPFKSTATVQLAMIAYNTVSIVKWDQEQNQIPDNPQASALLKREYRGNLVHP